MQDAAERLRRRSLPAGHSVPASDAIGRIAELDGLRAISVIFVLLIHISYGRVSGGFLGVDVFFVLSGYLITMLLKRELDRTGRIDLPRFYARRVLRILPPLVIAVLLAVLTSRTAGPFNAHDAERVAAVLLFVGNFLPEAIMGNLVHCWSLAIEEQFYLFWPALLLVTPHRHRTLSKVSALAIIASAVATRVAMVAYVEDLNTIYTFTLSRLDGIMLGSLMALVERPLTLFLTRLGSKASAWLALGSLLLLFVALGLATRPFMQAEPLGFLAFALVAAVLIFTVPRLAPRNALRLSLRHPVSQWLGQRSYGLYLYHYPIFLALEAARAPGSLANFAGVAALKVVLSLLFTELAWRLVEQPLLTFKASFAATKNRTAISVEAA